MAELRIDDVGDLLLGAQLLSSGGGTAHSVMAPWLERVLAGPGAVRLTDVAELPDAALCVPVALIGSPTVLEEKLPAGDEFVRAVQAMQRRVGEPAAAIAALDVASLNALTPVLTAAQLELPLVDADGMGRVFPQVGMTVWAAEGIPAAPIMLAGAQGDVVALESGSNLRVERFTRSAIAALGGWAAAALYPMTAATLARYGIHGSLSRALWVGRVVSEAQRRGLPRGRDLARDVGARLLFTGEVVEVTRPAGSGDVVVLAGSAGSAGHMLRLDVQNECLLAVVDGAVVAAVPDLICPVEHVSAEPVGVEQLCPGKILDILGFDADPAWHTPAGLALAGPSAFGYSLPSRGRP